MVFSQERSRFNGLRGMFICLMLIDGWWDTGRDTELKLNVENVKIKMFAQTCT